MKVSIITVCRNVENEIEETIKSVISQKKGCNIEYIVIDGGSSDATLTVLQRYGNKIDILISEKDNGIYDAMNKGVRLASGDIIGFLNSGDRYSDGSIHDVICFFKETNADVVYGHVVYTHDGKARGIRKAAENASEILTSMIACHQGIFVKTEIQKKHEFYLEYQIAADRKMLLDLYLEGCCFSRLDKILAYYDDSGFSSNCRYELMIENFRITYQMLMSYPEYQVEFLQQIEEEVYLNDYQNRRKHDKNEYDIQIRDYFFSKIDRGKKIIIWGTGFYGKQAMGLIRDLGYEILFFIESSPLNKKIGNYLIYSPETIPIDLDNAVLLIATKKYLNEILNKVEITESLKVFPRYIFTSLLIEFEKSKGNTIERILYGD